MSRFWVGCGEWGFRELSMERHFEIARDFGFRCLEFGIGGDRPGRLPVRMTDGEKTTYRKLVERFGIRTPFCCLENDFTLPDPAAHARMVRDTLEQIEQAAALGATHARLFAGFTPAADMTEAIWKRLAAAFAEADGCCRRLGLVISIETHGRIAMKDGAAHHTHTVTTDPASLRRLLRELPPRVGFNFDPGNLKAADPADRTFRLDLLNDRINYCHLKDWRRKGAGWEAVAPGDDDLDYAALLPRMKFGGPYLIEYEPTADVEDGLRRSLEYLRKIGFDLLMD